jgi:hypothetical protein
VAYFILVHWLGTFGDDRVLIVCGLSRFILAARAPIAHFTPRLLALLCAQIDRRRARSRSLGRMHFARLLFRSLSTQLKKGRTCRAQHNSRELSTDRRASLIFASRLETSTFDFPHDSITFLISTFF